MKCKICNTSFKKKQHNQSFCSTKCKDRNKYIQHRDTIIKRSLNYYYQNRDEVIKKQTALWKKKYALDESFRKKRQFRDKSIKRITLVEQRCEVCDTENDLHRHHPNYEDYENVMILCRPCHNDVHSIAQSSQMIP